MFTGIIQLLGTVVSNLPSKDGRVLVIKIPQSINVKIGDSISIDGCCLTVIKIDGNYLTFFVSKATIEITTLGLFDTRSVVNIEPAMLASSPFGGHIVSGHIDEVAKVIIIKRYDNSCTIRIQIKRENTKYVIEKGSITINGISLTIMKIVDDIIDINIIPHTWDNTNLQKLDIEVNNVVNIEYDQIVKIISKQVDAYIEKCS